MATHLDNVIRRKVPAGWEPYQYESIEGGFIITGSIPTGHFKSGPRKGKLKWDKNLDRQFLVTDEELAAERKRYEAETGNCENCFGEGKEFASWSKTDGVKTRECPKCKGTGKAAIVEASKQ